MAGKEAALAALRAVGVEFEAHEHAPVTSAEEQVRQAPAVCRARVARPQQRAARRCAALPLRWSLLAQPRPAAPPALTPAARSPSQWQAAALPAAGAQATKSLFLRVRPRGTARRGLAQHAARMRQRQHARSKRGSSTLPAALQQHAAAPQAALCAAAAPAVAAARA